MADVAYVRCIDYIGYSYDAHMDYIGNLGYAGHIGCIGYTANIGYIG